MSIGAIGAIWRRNREQDDLDLLDDEPDDQDWLDKVLAQPEPEILPAEPPEVPFRDYVARLTKQVNEHAPQLPTPRRYSLVDLGDPCDGCKREARVEVRDQHGTPHGKFCRRCGNRKLKQLQPKPAGRR